MKILFTLLFLSLSLLAMAQIPKGTKMVGGNIGGLSGVWGENKDLTLSLSLNPNIVKFYSNRFAFGGSINAGIATGQGDGTSFTLGIGPLARWYNNSIKSDRFFIQAALGGTTVINGDPFFYFSYGAGVGYNRFFTKHVALEAGLNYLGLSGDVYGYNAISLNLGFQIFLSPGKLKKQILGK